MSLPAPTGAGEPAASGPTDMAAVATILAEYRSGMGAMIERLHLPHDLPPEAEVLQSSIGTTGPLKPTLVEAFAPRGYGCKGGSGTFTLRRRTAGNHAVDLELDVGTWSRSVTTIFSVQGPGFNATLFVPVTARAGRGQYPIGDTANWERIVANLGVIVDELDRAFVPEVAAAAGPAPEWFEPWAVGTAVPGARAVPRSGR